MAKKSSHPRKPSGAAAIPTIETVVDHDAFEPEHEANGEPQPIPTAAKPKKAPKASKPKTDPPAEGSVGVGDIKKAAAFANSIGGLDKAIALLQILKVAKEVQ